ncbi:MAG: hypothetical protein FWF77_04860 [Defluviitaleaceae bacterium]|nr:hypothetical protein [Defluviitaleaceae bacterium]
MPNILEIQVAQKENLFELMLLEKQNKGATVKGLGRLIRKTKSGMTKEDIAYVKELVDEENEF